MPSRKEPVFGVAVEEVTGAQHGAKILDGPTAVVGNGRPDLRCGERTPAAHASRLVVIPDEKSTVLIHPRGFQPDRARSITDIYELARPLSRLRVRPTDRRLSS
jgi:hypothetical protein